MRQKVEGYWDCPYCSRKANKGRYRNCPGCGKPRGKDTKFYLIEKDHFVANDVVPDGSDWFCECCDSYNTSSANYCVSCGAPKGAAKDYFEVQKSTEKKIAEVFPKGQSREKVYHIPQEVYYATESASRLSYASSYEKKLRYRALGLPVLILLLLGILGVILIPKNSYLKVTELSWERSIQVDVRKTVRESGWSVPAGGRVIYTNREIKSYVPVLDHYETKTVTKSENYISGYHTETEYVDLGNGYFDTRTREVPEYSTRYYQDTEQVPVYRNDPIYATKYYYDMERWVYARTEKTSGINITPYWPELNLSAQERESTKIQRYFVVAYDTADKKKTQRSYTISYELWEQLKVNDEIDATVSFGKITKFEKK